MATETQIRNEAARLMASREKMNDYTQNRPAFFFGYPRDGQNPGRSDCSSSIGQAIERAGGPYIGGNTDAQLRRAVAEGRVIEWGNGKVQPDESKLLPGDCIYFEGNASHYRNVGHVEMFVARGTLYGHGSGKGPSKHNLASYCKARGAGQRYLCTVRWIGDPKAVPEPVNRTLKKGATGSDVRLCQQRLLLHGMKLPKYGADGDYGPETINAVKAFQTAQKLSADGVTGPMTWAALLKDPPERRYTVVVSGLTGTVASTLADELKRSGYTVKME